MKKLALLTLLVLAACVPTTRYTSPDAPIVYPVAYRSLFDATLQELTATYVPDALDRRTFSITQANPDTGLITAVRNQPSATATLRYRYDYDEDDDDYGPWPFFGLNFAVPVPSRSPEQTIITIVIRPEGQGASIIYSSQSPSGSSSYDADRLMRQVIARLDARFLIPATANPSPAVPMQPANP